MISYIDNLYFTDKTRKHEEKIIKSINENKVLSKNFIIILSLTDNDVFDIIPHVTIKSLCEKNLDIKVLGVAESKKAAIRLTAQMIDEYMQSGTDKSMREYFEYMQAV